MKKAVKVWIKLRGSIREYENGQEIEVDEAEAVQLVSLGYAVKIEAPNQAKE